jgi:hypothetical protein
MHKAYSDITQMIGSQNKNGAFEAVGIGVGVCVWVGGIEV